MTVRDEAIKIIEEGGMVVVNRQAYTLRAEEGVTLGLSELPPIEAFVAGDARAEAEALVQLRREKADLEARLAKLDKAVGSKESKEEVEVKTEAKEVKKA